MDILIILLIAAGLIGLIVLAIKGYSLLSIWRTARRHGLKPDLIETFALSKFYELEEPFLSACVAFKRLDPSISVREIVNHHMADGDTYALLDKWSELHKRKLQMSFKSAILYDLSGKDIIEIAARTQESLTIKIEKVHEAGVLVIYSAKFIIKPESQAWVEPDLAYYEEVIWQKIDKGLQEVQSNDLDAEASRIDHKLLDEKFWLNLCHGTVLEQSLKFTLS